MKGKVVLVTGGTSGISRATAIAYAREGRKSVVSGRRESEGQETVNLIRKAGGEAVFIGGCGRSRRCRVARQATVKRRRPAHRAQ